MSDAALHERINTEQSLFINGRWSESASGRRFPVFNPATGQVVAHVSDGDAADARRAVDAAYAAFPSGRACRPTAGASCCAKPRP